MSGHSKWATTKHKKAAIDAKRGKLFARLIKNIEVAARTGGADPAGNPTLFDAIQKAKKNSVPADNITRAVKRGSGEEAGGADWQTIMYEGYGPAGVAFLVECLTDNRNRAASDVRVAFTRTGGSLADPGSVSYLFSRRGVVEVPAAETLIGKARLLRTQRAYGHAASALRSACASRIASSLGVSTSADRNALTQAFTLRGLPPTRYEALLWSPPPVNEAALVQLANDLDAFEKEIRHD